VAYRRNVAVGKRQARHTGSRRALADRARRPAADVLPACVRQLQADQDGRVFHVERRVGVRSDVRFRPGHALRRRSAHRSPQDQEWRIEHLRWHTHSEALRADSASFELPRQVGIATVKRKGSAHSRDEQRSYRERCNEHAFLFGPDERCLGMVERNEWDLAFSLCPSGERKTKSG